jgi:hypothetical protein
MSPALKCVAYIESDCEMKNLYPKMSLLVLSNVLTDIIVKIIMLIAMMTTITTKIVQSTFKNFFIYENSILLIDFM